MIDPELERELTALGERLDVPAAPDEARLMNGIRRSTTGPPPESSRWPRLVPARLRSRRLVVVVVAFVACGAVLAAAPYVLRFAGIEFRPVENPPPTVSGSPSPAPSVTTPTPTPTPTLPGAKGTSLEEAQKRAQFVLVVPKKPGAPESVELADGDPPRVVSLLWKGIRLDEFDGTLGPYFFKKIANNVELVKVGSDDGIWVDAPHEVVYTDRNGNEHSEDARMSEKTLIWQHGKTTLRLEGDFTKAEALRIATS